MAHGLKCSLNWTKEELTLYQTKLGKSLFGSLRLRTYWRTLVLLLPGGMRGAGRTELAPWPASGACSARTPRSGCLPASQHRTPFTAKRQLQHENRNSTFQPGGPADASLCFRHPSPLNRTGLQLSFVSCWASRRECRMCLRKPSASWGTFVFSYKRSVQKGYISLRSGPWELSQLQLERFLKLFRVQEKGLEFPDGLACIGAISG